MNRVLSQVFQIFCALSCSFQGFRHSGHSPRCNFQPSLCQAFPLFLYLCFPYLEFSVRLISAQASDSIVSKSEPAGKSDKMSYIRLALQLSEESVNFPHSFRQSEYHNSVIFLNLCASDGYHVYQCGAHLLQLPERVHLRIRHAHPCI